MCREFVGKRKSPEKYFVYYAPLVRQTNVVKKFQLNFNRLKTFRDIMAQRRATTNFLSINFVVGLRSGHKLFIGKAFRGV